MSQFWVDNGFPADYSRQLLLNPRPAYIAKFLVDPVVVWDFNKFGGDIVQLDRYGYFSDVESGTLASYTKEARSRKSDQTIGTNGGRSLSKEKVFFQLRELTGPADAVDPNTPGNVTVSIRDLQKAKQTLFDLGNITAFNNSIGASRLADDFMLLEDRIYIYELLSTTNTYNPAGFADGATVDLSANGFGGKPPKVTTKYLRTILETLVNNDAQPFNDGNYRCLCELGAINHLKEDPEFLEVARYPGGLPVQYALAPSTLGAESPAPPQLMNYGTGGGMAATPYQAGSMAGQTWATEIMPTGFVFEGFRFFASRNVPRVNVTLNYSNPATGVTGGSATRSAYQMIFFGREAIGLAIGGMGPEIRPHHDTDYNRKVSLIWCHFMETKLLNNKFVVVARSYIN